MKNRKVAAYLGIALFALAAGCGTAGEKPPAPAAKAADTELYKDEDAAADSRIHQPDSEAPDKTGPSGVPEASGGENQDAYREAEGHMNQPPEPSEEHGESETLVGTIKSIEEDTLVVSQAFEEGENMMYTPVDGSPDESLVTVRIAGDTQYEVKTVKNGGVNGDSDVETRRGSFSDLEQEVSVNLRGSYEGDVFVAEEISICRFL